MDYYQDLKKYTELPGPMGHEERVQKQFISDLKPYAETVELTSVGNVVAKIGGTGRKVVVFGHADEIGYFVLSITDDGFLHITKGNQNKLTYPYTIVGQKALVVGDKGDVRGAFVSSSGHVLAVKERDQSLEQWNIVVDVGADSREEVEAMGIHVGSPIIWNPTTERLGDKVFGKAMDDRFTFPIMIELAKRVKDKELNCELYLAATVQEEVGQHGAKALSRNGFDVSIALDIGIAGDYPSVAKGRATVELGAGPVIVYKDGGTHYNMDIIKELRVSAEKNGVPYQHGIFEHYVSDSAHMIAGGSKAVLLCTPTRYSHSPIEMIHLGDMEQLVQLLVGYVTD
ncbi:MAG: M20/M25/M40 family metallo-hydrolase [Candidatus Bathyarchaeota archaeon]|nr:M20/M25/M40 family metallo-hydrolase [Candidatus Bathyarchaeota archaeon]